jgi:hypothetical protein
LQRPLDDALIPLCVKWLAQAQKPSIVLHRVTTDCLKTKQFLSQYENTWLDITQEAQQRSDKMASHEPWLSDFILRALEIRSERNGR